MGWSLSSESITHFYDELYNYLWVCGKVGLQRMFYQSLCEIKKPDPFSYVVAKFRGF